MSNVTVTQTKMFCEGSLGAIFQKSHHTFREVTETQPSGDHAVVLLWTNDFAKKCEARIELNAKCRPENVAHFKTMLYVAAAKMMKEDRRPS